MEIESFIRNKRFIKPTQQCLISCVSYDIENLPYLVCSNIWPRLPYAIKESVLPRQGAYIAGRYALLDAVRAHADCSLGDLLRSRTHLLESKVLPSFSISHSATVAIAGVLLGGNNGGGIGVDVEPFVTEEVTESMWCKLSSSKERFLVTEAITARQEKHSFTLLFSIKESLFKALYPIIKRPFYFRDVEVIALDPKKGSMTIRLCKELSDIYTDQFQIEGGFRLEDDLVISWIIVE